MTETTVEMYLKKKKRPASRMEHLVYRPHIRLYYGNKTDRLVPLSEIRNMQEEKAAEGFRFMFTCFWRKVRFSKEPPSLIYYKRYGNESPPILHVGHPPKNMSTNSVEVSGIRAIKDDFADGDDPHPLPVLLWSAEGLVPWWDLHTFVELKLRT